VIVEQRSHLAGGVTIPGKGKNKLKIETADHLYCQLTE
jgi:hypothetical protein